MGLLPSSPSLPAPYHQCLHSKSPEAPANSEPILFLLLPLPSAPDRRPTGVLGNLKVSSYSYSDPSRPLNLRDQAPEVRAIIPRACP